MAGPSRPGSVSTALLKVAERAKREPRGRFHSLAHLIDVGALVRSYQKLRKEAAVGVDGVDKERYGLKLEENLRSLHGRMKAGQYRHQPIKRVHIPKEGGKERPIGISALEDKVVQGAIREVLEAVYEQDFLDCSFGFRPGRGAHDALRALDRRAHLGEVNWILEADIKSFFDSLDRAKLVEMLRERIVDGALLRLIGKCLHVGVLEGEEFTRPDEGTAQGSALSPMLGNIYLHHVLDVWFEREVKPRLKGKACLIRYADDFVVGFELEQDARRVFEVLPKRMERYGLRLHPEKTRLLPFRRPSRGQQGGKGPSTFDLLGFTLYWRRARGGRWTMQCKTRRARLRRATTAVSTFCRDHRHLAMESQHKALSSRLRGHYAYFGVNGNSRSLWLLHEQALWAWFYWLRRRSQRTRLTWKRFTELLRVFPLPRPRIYVQIWG